MPKYKITKTDILHNGKLYPNGSEINLGNEDAAKLADYLIPLEEKKTPARKTPKSTENPKGTETQNEVTE